MQPLPPRPQLRDGAHRISIRLRNTLGFVPDLGELPRSGIRRLEGLPTPPLSVSNQINNLHGLRIELIQNAALRLLLRTADRSGTNRGAATQQLRTCSRRAG
jgi:hypothetical protein